MSREDLPKSVSSRSLKTGMHAADVQQPSQVLGLGSSIKANY
jgi:hypothetical protein